MFGLTDADDWKLDGICAQTDPEAFFPEKGGSTREAKRVCMTCPVRAKCIQEALANDEKFGVWGATTPRERRKLRHRGEAAVAAKVAEAAAEQPPLPGQGAAA